VSITPRRRRFLAEHPARTVVSVFLLAISAGTVLLLLPFSTAPGRSTSILDAAFTATSAVCVTGLAVVETGTHWSPAGQIVILALIELGGLGFMTIASLIAVLFSRRLGLSRQLMTNTERGTLNLGDVPTVLRGVGIITVTVQLTVAAILVLRLMVSYDVPVRSAIWDGVFHSVSAFNNAGFALWSDSLVRFASDPVVVVPVMLAIFIGGLGFPVLVDLHRHRRWSPLSLHAKLSIATTLALFIGGAIVLSVLEWRNGATLGGMPIGEKLMNGAFASITPRTAGFNTVEVADLTPQSQLITIALMFVGAGSAGTSGGIKVGTFAVLALIVWAQLRGADDVSGFRRRLPERVQRQAITVTALAMTLVLGASSVLLVSAGTRLGDAVFEAVSAFGTVGLSTGITPDLPATDQLILMMLMLVGRVGPITLGAALVLRNRPVRYRFPEEGPLIG
jgi:trk system potassium uptake protein